MKFYMQIVFLEHRRDLLFIKGNIRFENKNIILNSEKATLGTDNIIEFYNPVKYIIKDGNNEKNMKLTQKMLSIT